MFRSIILLNPSQLIYSYYFCILKIAPDYEVNELGIGKEILLKAISKSCGREVRQLSKEYQKEGDLGAVAANSKMS